MMLKKIAAVLFAWCVIPVSAHASDKCAGDPMELSANELFECNAARSERLEKKLAQAYKAAQQVLAKRARTSKFATDPPYAKMKATLIASQQAWQRYRELQCDFLRDGMGAGTEAPSMYQGCMQDFAEARIKWLEEAKQ